MSAVGPLRYLDGPPRAEPAAKNHTQASKSPGRSVQPAVILRLGQGRHPLLQGYAGLARQNTGAALNAHRHRQQVAAKQAEMLHDVLLDQTLGAVTKPPSNPTTDAAIRELSGTEQQILDQGIAMISSNLDLLPTDDAVPDRRTEIALQVQADFSGHAATLAQSTVEASILQATESQRTGLHFGPGPPVELAAYATRRSE